MEIKDSGNRREFESGAVRDIAEGKGRCDLLTLGVIGDMMNYPVLSKIDEYIRLGNIVALYEVIYHFVGVHYANDMFTTLLELSKHYEEGAKKYTDRNWEKGIPLHCFIDSGVRHYLKFMRGDKDEPHDRAFLWNMFGAIWTHKNHPELIDLPFAEVTDNVQD
jgi:hypothetical protein